MMLFLQIRVLINKIKSFFSSAFHYIKIFQDIPESYLRQTMLPRPEEFAGAAYVEVDFGYLKSVERAFDRFEAFDRIFGFRIG